MTDLNYQPRPRHLKKIPRQQVSKNAGRSSQQTVLALAEAAKGHSPLVQRIPNILLDCLFLLFIVVVICLLCLETLCFKSSLTDAAEYIHSFKVGRVGDEELFDVIHVKLTPFKLGAHAKKERLSLHTPVLGPSGYRLMCCRPECPRLRCI